MTLVRQCSPLIGAASQSINVDTGVRQHETIALCDGPLGKRAMQPLLKKDTRLVTETSYSGVCTGQSQ